MGSGSDEILGAYPPTLHNPFAFSNSYHSRNHRSGGSSCSTSRETSPACSPYSSPTSDRRNSDDSLNNFGGFSRLGRRSGRSISPVFSGRLRRIASRSVFLRRRPSTAELALSEERSRCSVDSIERVGLGLMEPRPVDPMPFVADTPWTADKQSCGSLDEILDVNGVSSRPRYVMGGIFEVMEGTA
jgi:hypothetical protein